MKVTALIPDLLVKDVQKLSQGKNITDSLIIALTDWTSHQKLKKLNRHLKHHPLTFSDNFTAGSVRKSSRR